MKKSLFFSIDDFYDDPDSIRNIGLNATYNKPGADIHMKVLANLNQAGIASLDVHRNPKMDIIISKILGFPVRQLLNSGKFRLAFEGDKAITPLHFDDIDNRFFAGVLYLSKVKEQIPGTILYTHKETGMNTVTKESFIKINKERDLFNLDKWNIDLISYIRYNRLIVYPANRYHGSGPSFGKTKEEARFIQAFLWERI